MGPVAQKEIYQTLLFSLFSRPLVVAFYRPNVTAGLGESEIVVCLKS